MNDRSFRSVKRIAAISTPILYDLTVSVGLHVMYLFGRGNDSVSNLMG